MRGARTHHRAIGDLRAPSFATRALAVLLLVARTAGFIVFGTSFLPSANRNKAEHDGELEQRTQHTTQIRLT